MRANIGKRLKPNPNWKSANAEQITIREPGERTRFRVKLDVNKNIAEFITRWKEYVKDKK